MPSPRPWAPLADDELYALLRHFLPQHPQGRRGADLRARLDATFWIACSDHAWSRLPARFGKPDTVHRWFRRTAHQGIWHQMLRTLHDAPSGDPIRALAPWLLRACRRAAIVLGPCFEGMARRLGLLTALPGPPPLLPNPILAAIYRRLEPPSAEALVDLGPRGQAARLLLKGMVRLLGFATLRPRLSRRLQRAWS